MPQIDDLLARLQENGGHRAIVKGGAPVQLELPAGISLGAALPNDRVEALLAEILPTKANAALQLGDTANFIYYSERGPFQVAVDRSKDVTRLEIKPVVPTAPPAPGAPAAPAGFPMGMPPVPPTPPAPGDSIAAPQGIPPYGAPSPMQLPSNDSGQPGAVLPQELRGFNWGGLFLSWIWAIGNGTWIGLLGLIPCVGFIMRLVLGAKGNQWAWRNKKWKSVQHFRTAQMVWGIVGLSIFLLSIPIYAAVMFPVFARARENARRSACQSNMKQISLGLQQYALDHKGKCPEGTTMASWKTALSPYLKNDALFSCPSTKSGEEHYVLNPAMAGANIEKIDNAATIPVFFDAEIRHLETLNIAFADGHIKAFRESAFESEIMPAIESFVPNTRPSAE